MASYGCVRVSCRLSLFAKVTFRFHSMCGSTRVTAVRGNLLLALSPHHYSSSILSWERLFLSSLQLNCEEGREREGRESGEEGGWGYPTPRIFSAVELCHVNG